MSITPKNWGTFQHYKDRSPKWIKLHRALLDDFVFNRLPTASKALAPFLWLLASEYEGGKITAEIPEICFRLRMTENEFRTAIIPLIENGFFICASNLLADCKQPAIPEKRREEERRGELQEQTEKEGEESRYMPVAKKRRGRPRQIKIPLPDDWAPRAEELLLGETIGLDERACDEAANRMRDWAKANGIVRADWNAQYRNWITSPFQTGERKAHANGKQQSFDDRIQGLADEARRQERARGIFRPDDVVGGD